MPIIRIQGTQIQTWETFHDTFYTVLGFPGFYGRNMDAWIDCMSYIDDPTSGMTEIYATHSDPLVIDIQDIETPFPRTFTPH